jgi:3-deoxy-D-arabino-heptulosonate 7-phosphate (DAHP) synthase
MIALHRICLIRVDPWRHLHFGSNTMKLCGFEVGLDRPFLLIAGPCVVESEQLQIDTAGQLKEITSA